MGKPACGRCHDEAWVCESHPDEPWEHEGCGGAGMPCPSCNTDEPPRFGPNVLAVEYLTHDPTLN